MNDITSKLVINFGSLPRPGGGSRGARGGSGCGKQVGERGPRPEVVVMVSMFFVIVCFEIFFQLLVCLCPAPFCVELMISIAAGFVSNSCLVVCWPGYFEFLAHITLHKIEYQFRLTTVST